MESLKKKCGTCVHFFVKPPEVEIARHAPNIAACQPGMPHCLGGQVRGACSKWQERAENGYPMPLGMGPATDSTFSCPLWEGGGPSVKVAGSFNDGGINNGVRAKVESMFPPMSAVAIPAVVVLVKKLKDKFRR